MISCCARARQVSVSPGARAIPHWQMPTVPLLPLHLADLFVVIKEALGVAQRHVADGAEAGGLHVQSGACLVTQSNALAAGPLAPADLQQLMVSDGGHQLGPQRRRLAAGYRSLVSCGDAKHVLQLRACMSEALVAKCGLTIRVLQPYTVS